MEYKISEEYLDILIKSKSKSVVGRILKRIEIFKDEKILKASVKEVIYEELRDIKNTIDAFHQGLIFSLNRKDSTK